MNTLNKVVVNSDHNLVIIPVRFNHGETSREKFQPYRVDDFINGHLLALQEAVTKRATHCMTALQVAQSKGNILRTTEYCIEYKQNGLKRHFGIESYNSMVDFTKLERVKLEELSIVTLDQLLKSFIHLEIMVGTEEDAIDTISLLQSIVSEHYTIKFSNEINRYEPAIISK